MEKKTSLVTDEIGDKAIGRERYQFEEAFALNRPVEQTAAKKSGRPLGARQSADAELLSRAII